MSSHFYGIEFKGAFAVSMFRTLVVTSVAIAAIAVQPSPALAHCDAMDGPVVTAARQALEKNDVGLVLRWVPPDQEAAVRDAFARTMAVRSLGNDARGLADTWFFETLVRIHRAGEGAPFDGLKPAGHIEPFMASVDQSLDTGSVDAVLSEVTKDVTNGVRSRFVRAREARAEADHNVEAGRAYVAAYVDYLHYVEALHQAGAKAAEHHESAEPQHEHR
jgi:hypothetical protein